ncbi:hypothetical protein CONLIGDRAFT_712899 [Coniochaeta ligniaria NRRL 30616]|uniref:Rhodopsin domain-containing protein n=1 Tax=Coniochaeta ligniaria NRRL 30616 TaxID=1408157 RepID=A0A1J7IZA5_9PEZI|nr:hypothetical protein CONLIGDRAFT_712899 [Coniochaeta ligniaria NRRL 30616]
MDAFTTEAFTLLGVGLFVITLRTVARITSVGLGGLKADDYLMVLAAGVYSVETYLAYSVGAYWHGLANDGMTDSQRRLLSPSSEEYCLRVNGSKTQIAGWSTYTLLLWIVKAAMCTFYLRLTDGLNFRTRIYVGFVLIVTTWLAVLLSILFSCFPLSKNWQIYPDPGNFCQPAISRIDIFVTVVLNVVTDVYLLTIPIPMLWQSRLPPFKKAGLIVLFSGGIFVTMAGILRCVLIITDPINGAQQAGSWACRETFVAVVTSNLPMIFPLLRRFFSPLLGTLRSLSSKVTGYGTSTSRSAAGAGGEHYKLEDKNPRRGQGPRTANPITNFTFSESEERIVEDPERGGGTRGAGEGKSVGGSTPPGGGGIMKEVMVRVTEERKSRSGFVDEEFGSPGDYYLTQQVRRSGEEVPRKGTGRRDKRGSVGFARG